MGTVHASEGKSVKTGVEVVLHTSCCIAIWSCEMFPSVYIGAFLDGRFLCSFFLSCEVGALHGCHCRMQHDCECLIFDAWPEGT